MGCPIRQTNSTHQSRPEGQLSIKRFAVNEQKDLLVVVTEGSGDGQLSSWKLSTGEKLLSYRSPMVGIRRIQLNPDGTRIVMCSQSIDPVVKVFDVVSGGEVEAIRGNEGKLYHAIFHPKEDWVYTCDFESNVRVFDCARGSSFWLRPHRTPVVSVAYSRDGRHLAVGGPGAISA